MSIRRPTFPETLLQLVLGAAICLFIVDLIAALQAQCDLVPVSQYCQVWGAEGPSADFWNYRSQAAYLQSAIARAAILSSAALAPFFASSALGGIGLLLGVATLGSLELEFLGPMLLLP
jgi:hypothetical protein